MRICAMQHRKSKHPEKLCIFPRQSTQLALKVPPISLLTLSRLIRALNPIRIRCPSSLNWYQLVARVPSHIRYICIRPVSHFGFVYVCIYVRRAGIYDFLYNFRLVGIFPALFLNAHSLLSLVPTTLPTGGNGGGIKEHGVTATRHLCLRQEYRRANLFTWNYTCFVCSERWIWRQRGDLYLAKFQPRDSHTRRTELEVESFVNAISLSSRRLVSENNLSRGILSQTCVIKSTSLFASGW